MPPISYLDPLFTDFEKSLRRYAENLTHDYDQADDLVQEAFIQAVAHAELFNKLNPFQRRSWLYQVVKNRFIDQVRANRRRQTLLKELADVASSEEPSTAYAGEINLFKRVPDRYKELLVQRYVFGMTSEEIAQALDIPAATVRSRIRLAIQWLRSHPDDWI
jgi:RNA polymerase sigma-70 factor (ECF subfamily)